MDRFLIEIIDNRRLFHGYFLSAHLIKDSKMELKDIKYLI